MRISAWQSIMGSVVGVMLLAAPLAAQEPAKSDSLAAISPDSADRPPVLRLTGYATAPRGRESERARVVLRMILDTLGRVERKSIEVVSAPDSGFAGAARRAARQLRFDPGYSHGRRVRVSIVQAIRFEPR